jgi:LEA14-like dessication related protein
MIKPSRTVEKSTRTINKSVAVASLAFISFVGFTNIYNFDDAIIPVAREKYKVDLEAV